MNATKSLVALLTAVAAASSFAGEVTPDGFDQFMSVASRQDVHNAAVAARMAGLTRTGEAADYDFAKSFQPMLSRKQVAAEAAEARRLGLTQGGEVERFATRSEQDSIRRAGERAIGTSTLASR